MVWNFCISAQLSEIVKESAISCNYFFPHPIPHKSIKLKKFSKNVWKKFLLYETVNSNCHLMIATQQKHHFFCIHCTAKYKIPFFFQELFVLSQNERFLGFLLLFCFVLFCFKIHSWYPSVITMWLLIPLCPPSCWRACYKWPPSFHWFLICYAYRGKLWPEY